MIRVPSILLTAFGLLICPYVCLGKTGSLCGDVERSIGCPQASSCCDTEKSASPQAGGEIPAPCDDCRHECVVSKGTIATSQKTPSEIIQSITDAGVADFVLEAQPSASIAVTTVRREEVPTQPPHSGWQLRVALASFLL